MLRRVAAALAVPLLITAGLGLSGAQPPGIGQPFPSVGEATPVYKAGLTPGQVRKAYGFDQLRGTGVGQTIAIVVALGSPTIRQDVAVFNRQFGLPEAALTISYPQGKPVATPGGWAVETALDVEWAHAIAPAAAIHLVVARSTRGADLLDAVDYAGEHGASIISMSWGAAEFATEANFDAHFAVPGVRYVAATGDRGHGVAWPAVSPNVLAVGGTTLKTRPDGSYDSESTWSGSGGGVSAYEEAPDYQQGFQTNGKRTVPDVAMLADPSVGVAVYNSTPYGGSRGWFLVGGTSMAAPIWAGLLALAPKADVPSLYGLAAKSYSTAFHDVVSGSNGDCGELCTADVAYDAVTGLGSPQAGRLVAALGGSQAPAAAAPVE